MWQLPGNCVACCRIHFIVNFHHWIAKLKFQKALKIAIKLYKNPKITPIVFQNRQNH